MSEGWIKLYRKIMESSFYRDSELVHLWVHLMLNAKKFPVKWDWGGQEITLNPGQFITGRKKISEQTGINESKVQRGLKKFETCHMIEQQSNNRSRLITIVSWDRHQEDEQPANNKRTPTEQPANTNKESKKVRKKELNKTKSKKTFSDDSREMKICKYFFAVLQKSRPEQSEPNWQNWCKDIDLFLRKLKPTNEQIKQVINFAHDPANASDKFSWIPNLRSPKKLRQHFEQILLQSKQKTEQQPVDNGDERAKRQIEETRKFLGA